jgi:hypothetical protein
VSFMFEVYYRSPADPKKEAALTERISQLGGQLTYREIPPENGRPVCLTYEFVGRNQAEIAAESLRTQGEHVEGPMDYGPDEAA